MTRVNSASLKLAAFAVLTKAALIKALAKRERVELCFMADGIEWFLKTQFHAQPTAERPSLVFKKLDIGVIETEICRGIHLEPFFRAVS